MMLDEIFQRAFLSHRETSALLLLEVAKGGARPPAGLEHSSEKWEPVFEKRSCSNKKLDHDPDSTRSDRGLVDGRLSLIEDSERPIGFLSCRVRPRYCSSLHDNHSQRHVAEGGRIAGPALQPPT